MFIAAPHVPPIAVQRFGLFLELKRDGIRLWKRNGDPATSHIAEQEEVLNELRNAGYSAAFACPTTTR
jgi:hypothetical protein